MVGGARCEAKPLFPCTKTKLHTRHQDLAEISRPRSIRMGGCTDIWDAPCTVVASGTLCSSTYYCTCASRAMEVRLVVTLSTHLARQHLSRVREQRQGPVRIRHEKSNLTTENVGSHTNDTEVRVKHTKDLSETKHRKLLSKR